MHSPWANVILFILLVIQVVTGFFGLVSGAAPFRWVLWLHGIGAYGLIVLLYWKSEIILHAIRRKNRWTWPRIIFAFTALLLILTLISGLLWTFNGPIYLGGFSLVSLHIYISVPLMALMLWHSWKMRFVLRLPETWGRRLFLNSGLSALGGLLLWRGTNWGKERLHLEGVKRRFTGSYERGSFSRFFPSTSWIADYPDPIDLSTWRLTLFGAVDTPRSLTYQEVLDLSTTTRTEILDCTGGWYTAQAWRGVEVTTLLEQAGLHETARSVTFRAVSGYQRRFGIENARRFLLAVEVAGEPLRHGHGAPLRLVAVGERGVEWVKWIDEIEVNTGSRFWQMPLPVR